MRLRTPPMLQSSKAPTSQDSLCNLRAIKSLDTHLHAWAHNLMEVNKTRDEIAQSRIHTQRYMNNVWNDMVSLTPCLVLYCSFSTSWDNFSPTMNLPYRLITTSFSLVLYLYDYEQSNASPSTIGSWK